MTEGEAEPLASTAKRVAFVLLTQPREEGDRVVSVRAARGAQKPPSPDIRLYESTKASMAYGSIYATLKAGRESQASDSDSGDSTNDSTSD